MRMENDCDVKLIRHIRIIIYVILTEMNPFNDSNIDNSYDLDKRRGCFVNQMTITYVQFLYAR